MHPCVCADSSDLPPTEPRRPALAAVCLRRLPDPRFPPRGDGPAVCLCRQRQVRRGGEVGGAARRPPSACLCVSVCLCVSLGVSVGPHTPHCSGTCCPRHAFAPSRPPTRLTPAPPSGVLCGRLLRAHLHPSLPCCTHVCVRVCGHGCHRPAVVLRRVGAVFTRRTFARCRGGVLDGWRLVFSIL